MRLSLVFATVVVSLLAAQSEAQTTSPPVASEKARPAADPNQKICQDITVVGSRLATKRICATRAEWEAKKQDDKDTVDRMQRSPCVPGDTICPY